MVIHDKIFQQVDNENVKEVLAYLRKAIFANRNGEIVRSMAEKGVSYRKNFGVSLADLNKIAANCSQNEILAEQLWASNAREEMILAACLMPSGDFTYQKALEWAMQIQQIELAEVVAMKLFSKLPFAAQFAEELLKKNDEISFIIGLSVAIRVVATSDDRFCDSVLQILFENDFNNLTIRTLQCTFLENLLFVKPNFREKITQLLSNLHNKNETFAAFFQSVLL